MRQPRSRQWGAAFARRLVRKQCGVIEHDYDVCAHCGASSDELQADHYPRRFAEIWTDFQRLHSARPGHVAACMQLACNANHDGPGDLWRNAWRAYHEAHASFQPLCPACHTRKSVNDATAQW